MRSDEMEKTFLASHEFSPRLSRGTEDNPDITIRIETLPTP